MNSQGRVKESFVMVRYYPLYLLRVTEKKFKGRFVNTLALQTENLAVDVTFDWAQSKTMIDRKGLINSMDQGPF
jgi:hypothetical protein